MALTTSQKSDFISRLRQHAAKEVELRNAALALKREYESLDLGNVIDLEDFAGINLGLAVSDMTGVITSIDAMETTFNTGHKTNFNTFKA